MPTLLGTPVQGAAAPTEKAQRPPQSKQGQRPRQTKGSGLFKHSGSSSGNTVLGLHDRVVSVSCRRQGSTQLGVVGQAVGWGHLHLAAAGGHCGCVCWHVLHCSHLQQSACSKQDG